MVCVKGLKIGEGIPKICVPIVEDTQEKILNQARGMDREIVDLVEWRADFYGEITDEKKSLETVTRLRGVLREIPLLFTFRTAKEGGNRAIAFEEYQALLLRMAAGGCVDLVDVEMFRGYDTAQRSRRDWKRSDSCNQPVIRLVRELSRNVAVIGSYHDFEKTPSREEILKRIFFMDKMGAAIPKIAVMPKEREDVLCLMETTLLAKRLLVEKPLITMAMGPLGAVTRLAGEVFESSVTFGCMGKASAPGQLEAAELRYAMRLLHTAGMEEA